MMQFIAILLAVAIAALLFVTFLKIRRDKRFVEDTRIAMLCTPQGVRQGEARARTLSVSRERFPDLIVFNTVCWENDWETMRSFIEY